MLLSALACLLMAIPSRSSGRCWKMASPCSPPGPAHHPFGAFCYGRVLNRLLILGLHRVLGSLIGLGRATCRRSPPPSRCTKGYVAGLYPLSCSACPVPVSPSGSIASGCGSCRRAAAHLALTLALVGITEPIEFLFAFTALAVPGPRPADRTVARHLQRASASRWAVTSPPGCWIWC